MCAAFANEGDVMIEKEDYVTTSKVSVHISKKLPVKFGPRLSDHLRFLIKYNLLFSTTVNSTFDINP